MIEFIKTEGGKWASYVWHADDGKAAATVLRVQDRFVFNYISTEKDRGPLGLVADEATAVKQAGWLVEAMEGARLSPLSESIGL